MKQLKIEKEKKEKKRHYLDDTVKMMLGLDESFTRKISKKDSSDLISKSNDAFAPDGVYILHTSGIKTHENWNPKLNNEVIGILLIKDNHKIVIAKEDSPKELTWSKEYGEVQGVFNTRDRDEAKSDFNGLKNTLAMNSKDYPAAYYCLNYKKFNKQWWLPSAGELCLIYEHLEEINILLELTEGQLLDTSWFYWTSTESSANRAWSLDLLDGYLGGWGNKISNSLKVRPVSAL